MPLLDVSDALLDPDFASRFTVLRRTSTPNQFGEETTQNVSQTAYGVITAASGNDLTRGTDFQSMGKRITIITRFRLQGPSPGKQADIVQWHGSAYLVDKADDYSHYGRGFIQAEATSTTYTDPPTQAEPV